MKRKGPIPRKRSLVPWKKGELALTETGRLKDSVERLKKGDQRNVTEFLSDYVRKRARLDEKGIPVFMPESGNFIQAMEIYFNLINKHGTQVARGLGEVVRGTKNQRTALMGLVEMESLFKREKRNQNAERELVKNFTEILSSHPLAAVREKVVRWVNQKMPFHEITREEIVHLSVVLRNAMEDSSLTVRRHAETALLKLLKEHLERSKGANDYKPLER